MRSHLPCPPSLPAIRTSSCCRLPSRAALSRRNTASETSGLPMKTRSTGRTSREPVESVIGDAAHHGIIGLAIGKADDAGGKGEQAEQADHRQHGEQPKDV